MAIICPAILTGSLDEYHKYFSIAAKSARRIHLDIMDGTFTDNKSLPLEDAIWPSQYQIDIHLMVAEPMNYIDLLINKRPHMVIIHNEANVHHMLFSAKLHEFDIQTGLALLKDTPVDYAKQIIHSFDHVLIFSGDLGHYGGVADLNQLTKVDQINEIYPGVEIGWDGGVNSENAKEIKDKGVEILNVGSYLSKSSDFKNAYDKLEGSIV